MNPRLSRQERIYAALLAEHTKRIAEAFNRAIQAARGGVDLAALEAAINANDLVRAASLLRMDARTLFPVIDALRAAYVAGGTSAAAAITARAVFGFDGRHVRAEAWVARQSGLLVQGIADDTLTILRGVVSEGLTQGRSGAAIARDITGRAVRGAGRSGGFLGLTTQQSEASLRAARELRELDDNYFTRALRDKRFDGTVRKAIQSGKPLSETDIKKIAGRYRDKQLAYRGKLIARNETHTALSAGRHEGFQQLVESGQVEAVTKRWQHNDAGQDPREVHQELGRMPPQDFNAPYTGIGGVPMQYPHDPAGGASNSLHCRCIAVYRPVLPRVA